MSFQARNCSSASGLLAHQLIATVTLRSSNLLPFVIINIPTCLLILSGLYSYLMVN